MALPLIELAPLLLWATAWGVLALLVYIVEAGKAHLNPHVLGTQPLNYVWNAMDGALTDAMQTAATGVAKWWHLLLVGLKDAYNGILSLTDDLELAVAAALTKLWHSSLPAYVAKIVNPVRALASRADTAAADAAHAAASAYTNATSYTDAQIVAAETVLRGYANTAARDARQAAEAYADTAVSKLRAAEDAAVSSAIELASQAEHAAVTAAAGALTQAEAFTNAAVARAEQTGAAALAQVQSVALEAEQGVTHLDSYLQGLGLTALVAAVPALATLVNTIATDSGLENASCRSKVKGICGTDPNVWSDLLGLLAPVLLTFDFKALYDTANAIAGQAAAIVKQAA